ncbi:MAG: 3-phosphoshikimate 1-carboxyvinyltransferase, partial [Candidatus Gastranaerophilales bacterium]|nr:3-phosphoshikimate 1-carboxyvinyltransferase [Candidatus Gastranaerophilales bacterium]
NITVEKANSLNGIIEIPADKSITHRAFMFASLTGGIVKVSNYSKGADCMSTLNIIQQLGCNVEILNNNELIINAKNALKAPKEALNCGNSGTSARLMCGILAGQNFDCQMFGDESLSKRPMKRVITPLELMGAKFKHNDYTLPLKIYGTELDGINYNSNLASAQVKSCILLAGLNADGETCFSEPFKSRNHTELMFQYMGADIKINGNSVSIKKSQLNPVDITVCGDISSAAFFIAAALIVPNSDILIINAGINETRSGIIDVLKKMNADIELINERIVSNEKVADIRVKYSELKGTTIEGEIIPRLIDEIPIIAVVATQAEGTTIIKDAQDLRNKETDRITAVKTQLSKLGADINETQDGLIINGKTNLTGGCEIECYKDHRIAMSAYIAGLICNHPIQINEFQWVNISFPEFLNLISALIT